MFPVVVFPAKEDLPVGSLPKSLNGLELPKLEFCYEGTIK
jgi:hypothetical protein